MTTRKTDAEIYRLFEHYQKNNKAYIAWKKYMDTYTPSALFRAGYLAGSSKAKKSKRKNYGK